MMYTRYKTSSNIRAAALMASLAVGSMWPAHAMAAFGWGNVAAKIVQIIVMDSGGAYISIDPASALADPAAGCSNWNNTYYLPNLTSGAEKAILAQAQIALAMGAPVKILTTACIVPAGTPAPPSSYRVNAIWAFE